MIVGSDEKKPKIIVIVGPTASGKTTLAITIAKRFDGEIVSADSRQIYRGMNIGTAKPTELERSAVPHYLLDIKNPDQDYTVAEYKTDAAVAVNDILGRGHLPLLVGGTGLYIRAIVENLDIPNIEADETLRASLENEMTKYGLESIVKKLLTLDPDAAQIVDLKNPRRVIRAIEVATATGQPFTAQRTKGEPPFDALTIGLDIDQETLRMRIDARIDDMFTQGFLDEVKTLLKQYGHAARAFDAIGYSEVIEHLETARALPELINEMKINTWHYAQRQMTWFRKDKTIKWIKSDDEAMALAEEFLRVE